MTETLAHSPLGGSSMERWSECPGSIRLSKGIKPTTSSYADEGTRAHEIAAHYLTKLEWPSNADEETIEAVEVYTKAVFNDAVKVKRWVEHRFDLSSIYPNLFGTADCVTYHAGQKLLRVYDYKHGQGIPVNVTNNMQLKYYGLGAMLSLKLLVDEIELIIVQPRCYHPEGPVRRYRLSAMEMLDFAADLLEAAERTEKPDAPLHPGDHCRFCPAKAICPVLHKSANEVAQLEFKPRKKYDPDELSKALTWLPILESWLKGVREFAYGEVQQGNKIPGWKLVAKRNTRSWMNEAETVDFLIKKRRLTPIDIYKDPPLKSPNQMEKLVPDREILAHLIKSESTGYTLCPDSDPRPSVKIDAQAEFKVITDEM